MARAYDSLCVTYLIPKFRGDHSQFSLVDALLAEDTVSRVRRILDVPCKQ